MLLILTFRNDKGSWYLLNVKRSSKSDTIAKAAGLDT